MNELQWLTTDDPRGMLNFLRPWASERRLRLFACACCRDMWDWLEHGHERHAVEVAEQFADHKCSVFDLMDANGISSRYAKPIKDIAIDSYWSTLGCIVTDSDSWDSATIVAWYISCLNRDRFLETRKRQCEILRDIFGNPFPRESHDIQSFPPHVIELAQSIYDDYRFDQISLLADELMKIGADEKLIQHCQTTTPHFRGCWAVDLILSKPNLD